MCWTPRLARFVSWCLAIAVHELLFILALGIQSEEAEVIICKPDLFIAMVPQVQPDPIASGPEWAGRWPLNCDHRDLLRIPPNQIVADTRCGVCQWPWWVIRAARQD